MTILGLKDKKSKKDSKAKNTQSDEAADILKKMEAKPESGDCPFC